MRDMRRDKWSCTMGGATMIQGIGVLILVSGCCNNANLTLRAIEIVMSSICPINVDGENQR